MAKSRRPLPDINKDVVQDPERTREQAAWELLYAVGDLFPERLEALRQIGERLVNDYIDELSEDATENQEAITRCERAVDEWAALNGVRCAAVIDAAREFARGGTPSAGLYLDADLDANWQPVFRESGIMAYPHNETRKEFLEKAGEYYDRVAKRFMRDGAKAGPVKRDREHFRYLAAHLVGRHSWAEIANGDTPLPLSAREQQSVAGGARAVAQILGIELTAKRGPRKGARRHRRPLRR